MSIKRYGKTYKNAEEIYNFIKDKKGVVLISIDDLEQKDARIAELEKQLAVRDKALELACKYCSFGTGGYPEEVEE